MKDDAATPTAQPSASGRTIHNVTDRRHAWIGSWVVEKEPLDTSRLTSADVGRTVIYSDFGRAEAGTLKSWSDTTAWVRFHQGDTAAACDPDDLFMAIRTLDGSPRR